MQRAKYGTNTEAEAEDILGLRPGKMMIMNGQQHAADLKGVTVTDFRKSDPGLTQQTPKVIRTNR